MDTEVSEVNPVGELAEEFVERFRRGERPPLKEYTDRYPQWADKIRAILPALVLMEQARPGATDATGLATGTGAAKCPLEVPRPAPG
jgi:hypothetical protein